MDPIAKSNQQTAVFVVLVLVLLVLLASFVWVLRRRRSEPFTVVIAGEPHSGKTRLFYALTAGCQPETVMSTQPTVYTGCVDACPGVLMRIVDRPSDPRVRGEEADISRADLVLYCVSGPGAASPDWKSLVYDYLVPLRVAGRPSRGRALRGAFRGPGPFSRVALLAPSAERAQEWNAELTRYIAAEGLAARKPGEISLWLEATAREQLWAGVNAMFGVQKRAERGAGGAGGARSAGSAEASAREPVRESVAPAEAVTE